MEIATAYLCANLPTLAPLIRILASKMSSHSASSTHGGGGRTFGSTQNPRKTSNAQSVGSFQRIASEYSQKGDVESGNGYSHYPTQSQEENMAESTGDIGGLGKYGGESMAREVGAQGSKDSEGRPETMELENMPRG